MTTPFTLTADGFDDAAADLPLSYRFFYYEEGEGARRTPLAPPSEASFLDGVLLPAGNVTVGCVVADAHGATCECEPSWWPSRLESAASTLCLAASASP